MSMTSTEIDEIATGCLLDQQNETQWRAFCDACEEMWGESDKPWELARLSAATPIKWVMNGPMYMHGTVHTVEDRVWAIEIATAVLGKAFYLEPTMLNWEKFKFACERGNVPWRAVFVGHYACQRTENWEGNAYGLRAMIGVVRSLSMRITIDKHDNGHMWATQKTSEWATILPASAKR